MNWYYVDNGQQAGPVDDAQLSALVGSGKIKPDTLVWHDGLSAWTAYSVVAPPPAASTAAPPAVEAPPQIAPSAAGGTLICSECGRSFPPSDVIRYADRFICANCKPAFFQRLREGGAAGAAAAAGAVSETDLLARDYEVDIGWCLSSAWELFKNNAGGLIGSGLVVGLVGIAMVFGLMLVQMILPIPFLTGPLWAMVVGPLKAGLWLYFLKTLRQQNPEIGDAFGGFGPRFWQLALTTLIPQLIFMAGALVIGSVTGVMALIPTMLRGLRGGVLTPPQLAAGVLVPLIALGTVFLIAWTYISVCWMFALPLVADKGLKFWPALELSRRMVNKHWWMTFLLVVVCGVFNFVAFVCCCVGLFVTVPLTFAMMNYQFQRVFGDLAPQRN